MDRKDTLYLLGLVVVAGLLLANLLRPTAPYAYDLTPGQVPAPVSISAAGDSAWAIIGTNVYYVTLRQRSELPAGRRSITTITSKSLE